MGGARAALLALTAGVALAAAAPPVAAAQDRAALDVRVFARVGQPGQPEPVAVAPDGTVYVGTNQQGKGDAGAPSKVFAFDARGRLEREYVVQGQRLDANHGIQGIALDGDGLLYLLDRAARPRVIVLDPLTGSQRDYALFRDVPRCGAGGAAGDCSATVVDAPSGPNFGAFTPDGTLFVTDIDQGLIWRVPKGGGRPDVWLTDPRMESVFGPNGIGLMADRRTLLFAQTAANPAAGNSLTGRLWTVPIGGDGRPGELRQLWESGPAEGPDGFAIGRSGRIYLALAGADRLAVIGPDGREVARVPRTAAENERQEIPFDGPASVAFHGTSVLVTNQTFPVAAPEHWAVLDVHAGERGLPLVRPFIRPRRDRISLSVSPRIAPRGRRTRFRFTATITREGRRFPVAGARVHFGRGRATTDATGRATITETVRHPYTHRASARRAPSTPGAARVRVAR